MLSVTKIVKFDAAHYLPQHEGQCKNLHGHTWKVEIEVAKEYEPDQPQPDGMIVDFSSLKKIIKDFVLDYVDHQCLNETSFELLQNPTAENLCTWVRQQMQTQLDVQALKVIRVRIWESEDSYAEWRF